MLSKAISPFGGTGSGTGCFGSSMSGTMRRISSKALGRAGGLADIAPHFRNLCQSPRREDRVEHELSEQARGHPPGQHIRRAPPQDRDDAREDEEDDDRGEECACHGRGAGAFIGALDGKVVAFGKLGFRGEGLDCTHRAHGLARERGGIGQCVLRGARAALHGAAEGNERQNDEGNGDQDERRQARARIDHHAGRAEEQEQIAERDGGRRAEGRFDERRVGGEPGDEFAGAGIVVEARRQFREMGDDGGPHIGNDTLAKRHDEVIARGTGAGEEARDRDHRAEIQIDDPALIGREAEIDDAAERERHDQGCRGGDHQRQQGKCDPPFVAQGERREREQGAQAPGTGSGGRGFGHGFGHGCRDHAHPAAAEARGGLASQDDAEGLPRRPCSGIAAPS